MGPQWLNPCSQIKWILMRIQVPGKEQLNATSYMVSALESQSGWLLSSGLVFWPIETWLCDNGLGSFWKLGHQEGNAESLHPESENRTQRQTVYRLLVYYYNDQLYRWLLNFYVNKKVWLFLLIISIKHAFTSPSWHAGSNAMLLCLFLFLGHHLRFFSRPFQNKMGSIIWKPLSG